MKTKMPIVVLISGRGRTLKNILDKIDAGELDVEVRAVIASTPDASGLQYAEQANIDVYVVERSAYETLEAFSDAVFKICDQYHASYVVFAGYLSFLQIPTRYENHVLNIHPSLIPSFCGKGNYGRSVHESALRRGVKITGCTVHFVDNEYDNGPIILQIPVEVREDDTTDTLSDRVLYDAEFVAYPKALQWLAEDRVTVVKVQQGSTTRSVVKIKK